MRRLTSDVNHEVAIRKYGLYEEEALAVELVL